MFFVRNVNKFSFLKKIRFFWVPPRMERNGVRRLHGCSQLTSWVRVGMGKLMKICGNAATCIAFHRDESLGTLIYSTIFTILWSLYVPNSDDCNYRTKITVSTAQ